MTNPLTTSDTAIIHFPLSLKLAGLFLTMLVTVNIVSNQTIQSMLTSNSITIPEDVKSEVVEDFKILELELNVLRQELVEYRKLLGANCTCNPSKQTELQD